MIALESDRMRVEVDPAFGARVTALWDKRAGREWLVTGPREAGDGATYGGAQARGWDECFPTIAACDHPAWGALRDHGLLWGRPWKVTAHGQTLRATYREERFAFTRTLDLHGATLTASYEVENLTGDWLPYVWSQHCLLAARPGERIDLDGLPDFTTASGPASWPVHAGRDWSIVGAKEDGVAAKLYAMVFPDRDVVNSASAALVGDDGSIRFTWDDVPALGLWLDWGGWPEASPVHQLALEPTSSPYDDLGSAERWGLCGKLAPDGRHATHRWIVRIDLRDPGSAFA